MPNAKKKNKAKKDVPHPNQIKLTRSDKKQMFFVDRAVDAYRDTIKYGVWIALFWFTYQCIKTLSGQETIAKFIVDVAADISLSKWVAYIFGAGGAAYGFGERRLRKRKVAQLSERCQDLEKRIDRKRSSSKMPPSGDTREEDKI